MKPLLCGIAISLFATMASAQETTTDKKPTDHPDSTGRTYMNHEKGEMQPQGPTGPINTGVGGAPPESPQGQTPPAMQSAPGGSSETIVAPPEAKK